MLFGRDCFALRKRFFCVSTEVVCQIKGGSFFKSLENNLCLRERNLRLAVQADPNDGKPLENATPDAAGKGIDQQGHSHPERITGKMQQNRTVM